MFDGVGGDIGAFLRAHGLEAHRARFEQEGIDLELLPQLGDDDLRELGLNLGDRTRFRNAVRGAAGASGRVPATVQHRNLTVLFCDLVDSTILANRLDREDYVDLVRAFVAMCSDAVIDAGGTVAKFTGDGLMAYFGYPQSHDDEASRAVGAGLAIQTAVHELDLRIPASVRTRVGIASGLAIVGHVLGDEDIVDALGDTPSLAARIEGVAAVGTVAVSDLTRRLASDDFEFADLGPVALKGFDEPVRVHRVIGTVRSRLSFEETNHRLVGRDDEIEQLLDAAEQARSGGPVLALIHAEPGIGKSSLVGELGVRAQVAGWRAIPLACHEHELTQYAHPVRHLATAAAGIDPTDPPGVQRAKLDELGERLGLSRPSAIADALFESADASPAQRRGALFDLVSAILDLATAVSPTLLVVEDVHWADSTTIDLIQHARGRSGPLFIVVTTRPVGAGQVARLGPDVTISLERLDDQHASALLRDVLGGDVDDDLARAILERSDGVPLFIEELGRHVLDQTAHDEQRPFDGDGEPRVPATLHDTLMARLDRLPSGGRLAPVAAALGRSFAPALLGAVATDVDIECGLDELIEAGLLERVGTQLVFRHALIQEIAYAGMLRSERRDVHGRTAEALLDRFPEVAATAPHRVAHHLERSHSPARAVPWWLRTAERAARHSANVEVVAAAEHALELLGQDHPDPESRRSELTLELLRAGALRGVAGFAADVTGAAYQRARDLTDEIDDVDARFVALNGVYSFHLVRDEYDLAGGAARSLLELAERSDVPRHGVVANRAMGGAAFHVGRFQSAEHHLARSIELYRAGDYAQDRFVYGTDHATTAACFLALTHWVVGREADAEETGRWATEHAVTLDHVHSWAQVFTYRCFLAVMARDWSRAIDLSDQLLERSDEHGLALMATTARFWGATGRCFMGDSSQLAAMHDAADAWWNTGARSYLGFRNTLLADAHATFGEVERGLDLIEQALARIETTGETWALAETHRVRARLLMAVGEPDAAAESAQVAIEIATAQGANAWASRADADLAEIRSSATTSNAEHP